MSQQIGIKLSLDGTAGVLSGLGQVQGGLGNLGTKISTVRDALTSFAPALAGAFTVGGLTAFVRNTTNAIDAMNDLADATGATIEEISKLDQVARRNGASLDSVGGMLVKFNAQLKEADGKNGASMALQAIGLEAAKLRALDPAEALQQTARALAGFADDGNKARIVQELFGKSVREAAPFLKDLAEAGVLNAGITTQQAAETEKFNKQLFALQANAGDAGRAILGGLLPVMSEVLKGFESGADGVNKFSTVIDAVSVPIEALAVLGANVSFVFKGMGRELGAIAAQLTMLAKGDLVGFRAIGDFVREDGAKALKELQDYENRVLSARKLARGTTAEAGLGSQPDKPSVRDIGGLGGNTPAAALSDEAKATAAAIQAREKYLETLTASAGKMAQENTALADQVAALTLGKDAYQRMIDVREEEAAVLLETQAIRTLDRNLDAREYEALMAQAAAIRQRIVLRRDLADATVQATDREIMARRAGLIDQDAAGALIDEQISKADALIAGIDGQTRALTMSNTEREVSIALLELERTGLDKNSDAYRDRERAIREAIANRETVREGIEQARRFEQEWQRTADQIGQSLSDALMQGGKSAADYIKGLFRSTVLRPIIQAIVRPFTTAIGGALGMGSNAMAGTGGTSGSAGGYMNPLANLMNGNTISATAAGYWQRGADWLSTSSSNTLASAGDWMSANPQIGSYLGMAGNAFAGYTTGKALKSAIGGKYEISKGYSTFQDIGMAVGSAIGGPVVGAIIGAATGVMNRAFGRKPKEVTESGIQGSLTGGMATGQQYQDWLRKGGWFRSDKLGTDRSALGDDMAGALSAGSQAMFQQTQAFAQTLSLPAAALATITSQFKVKFSGDAAKDQAEIAALFTKYGEDLAETYRDQLTPFQKAGETINATLQRMSGLQQFSNTINDFGGIFSRVASLSVDAKEQLLGFAGGIEALLGKTQQFVSQYYDEAEQAALAARNVQQSLQALGINATLYSRADFRSLVEGTDVSNEQGRQRLSQLLDIAAAFAPVGQFLEQKNQAQEALQSVRNFSKEINDFGGIFGRIASLGSSAKDQLVSMAGSIENLLGKAAEFVQNYYEEPERIGLAARDVQRQLASLGITGELYSRADFRSLVESTDISNEQGRQRLSQLLDIATAFAPVGQFLEAQGGSLSLLANTAPASGAINLDGLTAAATNRGQASLADLANTAPSSGIVGNVLSLDSVTAATNAASNANVNTLERLIARVGDLEAALVRALDKNARAVADVIAYESNINIQTDGGGA